MKDVTDHFHEAHVLIQALIITVNFSLNFADHFFLSPDIISSCASTLQSLMFHSLTTLLAILVAQRPLRHP